MLADYRRSGDGCQYYSYNIEGVGVNVTELQFKILPSPLSVSVGQDFHIWFGADLKNCSEDNNSGQTYPDVYAWYAWYARINYGMQMQLDLLKFYMGLDPCLF